VTPELWQRVRDLYTRAVEQPLAQRATFVMESARGDRALASEVLALLEVDEEAAEQMLLPAVDPAQTSLVGRQLGRWKLLRHLGSGGMGAVYLAAPEDGGPPVALKVLTRIASTRPRALAMFRREAAAVARLQHPGIVPLLDFGSTDGHWYYAMEFVAGRSLGAVLRDAREGRLSPPFDPRDAAACARLAAAVLDALQHAHERGIVHRDVKPDNILIDADGSPRLVDFGIAKDLALEGLSRTGEVSGTPHYMSPEQAAAIRRPVDHRSDLFSVAAVLYELLTLRLPFPGAGVREVLERIVHSNPRPIRRLARHVPVGIARVCHQALTKDPEYRFPSAAVFAALLRTAARGERVHVRREPLHRRAAHALAARPWATAVVGALAFGALGVTLAKPAGAAAAEAELSVRSPAGADIAIWWLDDDPRVPPRRQRLGTATGEEQRFRLPPGRVRVVTGTPRATVEASRELVAGATASVRVAPAPAIAGSPMRRVAGGRHTLRIGGADPAYELVVDVKPFWIDERVATNGELLAFFRAQPSAPELSQSRWDEAAGLARRPDWIELPATGIGLERAREFAEWCGKRLPTRAEWELAMASQGHALGPDTTAESLLARYRLGRPTAVVDYEAYLESVAPATWDADGLAHGIGNVWEWVDSPHLVWEGERVIARPELRVAKGWFWGSRPEHVLASGLAHETFTHSRSVEIGLRCARSAEP
jgi:serine/threonine-protein kinase